MYNFGSGDAFLIPSVAVPTPIPLNTLQDFSLDFKFEKKALHGKKQFPLTAARSKGTIEGKIKDATVKADLFGPVFFGDAPATGQLLVAVDEPLKVPDTTPFKITALAHKDKFKANCGVRYADTGKSLLRVEDGPFKGAYTVATPVSGPEYTFDDEDKGVNVLISYTYTSETGGKILTLSNKDMGTAPRFTLVYTTKFEGMVLTIQLNACQIDDLKIASKNDDFMFPEASFSAFANAAGVVGMVSITE